MNRRRTILTTSLLTLVFGVAPATLWLFRHRSSSSAGKRPTNELPLAAAQVVSAAEQQEDAELLDKVFTKDDKLSYNGYVIEKSQDKGEESWSAALKKGNKTLVRFESGWNREWTSFGLFPFISRDSRQLVVEQYSGGAHCCYSYWIYDLSAHTRLLFDNGKYKTGNQLFPVDIDRDGTYELKHAVMAFDYFHMSHASSVFPHAIFAYDKRAAEYRPANLKFQAHALGGIDEDIKEQETLKAQGNPDNDETYSERYFSAVLQVTLKYIYAGKRDEGWSFFNREYRTHEGISREKMRAEIDETLQEEPVYKYIYPNRPA